MTCGLKLSDSQIDAVVALLTSNSAVLTAVMDGEPTDRLRELLRSIGGAVTSESSEAPNTHHVTVCSTDLVSALKPAPSSTALVTAADARQARPVWSNCLALAPLPEKLPVRTPAEFIQVFPVIALL